MRAGLAAVLLLAGCSSAAPLPPHAEAPRFDPIDFFDGRSAGTGTLDMILKSPVPIRVESVGRRINGDGLVLDQRIREGARPPRLRRWVLRPAGANRWTGSLTDAEGPVTATVDGNSLRIDYVMKNGLEVEQLLRLRRDGRSAANRMTIRKWGIPVASVEEHIRTLD